MEVLLFDPKLWDESVTAHQGAGTFGKLLKKVDKGIGDTQGLIFGA